MFGTCPKCKTNYILKGDIPPVNAPVGYLCPTCEMNSEPKPDIINFKTEKPTLIASATALIRYCEDNIIAIAAPDPNMCARLLYNLRDALNNHIMEKMEK